MRQGEWKWLLICVVFAGLTYGGLVLPLKWWVVSFGASLVLMLIVWLLVRSGKLPDDSESYADEMRRRPGESVMSNWFRRFLRHL